MGNVCQGEDIPLQFQEDQNLVASSNIQLKKYQKDRPKASYAVYVGKKPILTQIVQKTRQKLHRQQSQRDAYQRGVPFGTYCLKVQLKPQQNNNPYPSLKSFQRAQSRGHQIFYEGEWLNGKPNGNGKLYLPNGAFFEGGFDNGTINCDDGISIYPDGSYYRGHFKDSQCEGLGKFVHQANGVQYNGDWLNNLPHNYGTEKYKDGSQYSGHFVKGVKHGQGIFKWADGKKYRGQFKNGYICGKGVLVKGQSNYQGLFDKNQIIGHKDGRGKIKTKYGDYEGQFKNGEMNGQGVFRWTDGKIYQGQFKRNKLHGTGMISYPNGQKVEGLWYEGENNKITDIKMK